MSRTPPYTSSSIYLSVDGLAAGQPLTDMPGEDITANRHERSERIAVHLLVGPSSNAVEVSFSGSRADLLALLERMRAALDAVPPHPAGGEAA